MTQQHIEELLQKLNKKFPTIYQGALGQQEVTTYGQITRPNSLESTRLAKENEELRESLRIMQEEMNRVLGEKCVLFDRLTKVEGAVIRSMRKAAQQE